MLAAHPDILARLRGEVLDTLGPDGKVSPENLREMKYLRAVLNGKWFLASRRPSMLTCHRDAEVVPGCVRINISPTLIVRLRRESQPVEYQMLKERCYLASP